MKKRNEDDPDNLGGLGGMLPAEVLKMLNQLLERTHQAGGNKQGSKIEFVYVASGGQHVDHVDNQFFIGEKWVKALHRKESAEDQSSAENPFDENTPLSALFRKNHHEELRMIIESWRPYLLTGDSDEDVLYFNDFQFDLTTIRPVNIYMDLTRLINHDALCFPMSILAAYMFQHSNLSKSENALYVQLKRYRKICT